MFWVFLFTIPHQLLQKNLIKNESKMTDLNEN